MPHIEINDCGHPWKGAHHATKTVGATNGAMCSIGKDTFPKKGQLRIYFNHHMISILWLHRITSLDMLHCNLHYWVSPCVVSIVRYPPISSPGLLHCAFHMWFSARWGHNDFHHQAPTLFVLFGIPLWVFFFFFFPTGYQIIRMGPIILPLLGDSVPWVGWVLNQFLFFFLVVLRAVACQYSFLVLFKLF